MEVYTKQSYEPVYLHVTNSGRSGMNGEPQSLVINDLIVQNLLYLAYDEPITENDLAKTIGIPMPYIEPIVNRLVNAELMRRIGNKVYTDFIIYSVNDQEKYVPAQVLLVNENKHLFTRAIDRAIKKITALECYKFFTFNQRSAFELYLMLNCLDYGIYGAFSQIYNATQIFHDRPNGGKWIAFGRLKQFDSGKNNNIEYVKYSYAGERHTHLRDYLATNMISFHVYDLEGLGVKKYFNCPDVSIDEDDMLKLLYATESGVNFEKTGAGFNTELLKAIPWLADCSILRYENEKPKLDIPVVSSDEWKEIQTVLHDAQNELIEDITDLLTVFLKDKKIEIPKHLTSVPLQKQYACSISALAMAVIRLEIQARSADENYKEYIENNKCPYPMVLVVDK